MVNSTGSEPDLGDLESATLAEQHVRRRYPYIVEPQVQVSVGSIVLAEHFHGADLLDAGGVHRHQDLRLALMDRPFGIGLHHDDHDLAAGVARS